MQRKKFVFIFFGFSFFMIFAFLFVIWYRDPLHLYHKPYSYKDEIFGNMRIESAGLIKHHDFDSLIFWKLYVRKHFCCRSKRKFGREIYEFVAFRK
ncbi:MAG: hypothetical protein IKH66_05435 [Campylobacter sp.]|nr:hypothetical protein [Campylobacter sp.]